MWLSQKKYELKSKDGFFSNSDLSKINLKINDKLTTIKLKDLFLKTHDIDLSSDKKSLKITGWSVLQSIPNNILTSSEDKKIKLSFHSEENGDSEIISVKNPIFQLSDKEITDKNFNDFKEKIFELSAKADKQAEEESSPHLSTSVVNPRYETAKLRYLNSGYKEHIFENFRLLNHQEKAPILIQIIDEKETETYQKFQKLNDNFYQFEDQSNNRKINTKLIDNQLVIEFIEIPTPENVK